MENSCRYPDASAPTSGLHSSPCAALIKAALTQLQQAGAPVNKDGALDSETLRQRALKPLKQPEAPHAGPPQEESRACSCVTPLASKRETGFSQHSARSAAPADTFPASVSPCAMLIKAALAQCQQEGTSVDQEEAGALKKQVLKPVPKPAEATAELPPSPCAPSTKASRPADNRPAPPRRSSLTTRVGSASSAVEGKLAQEPASTRRLTFTAADLAAEVEARRKRRASAATVGSRRTTASSATSFLDDPASSGSKPLPSSVFDHEPLENIGIPVTVTEEEDVVVVSSTGIPVVAPWPMKTGASPFSLEQKITSSGIGCSCPDTLSLSHAQTAESTSPAPLAAFPSLGPKEPLTRPTTAAESWLSDGSETEEGTCSACTSPPDNAEQLAATPPSSSLPYHA